MQAKQDALRLQAGLPLEADGNRAGIQRTCRSPLEQLDILPSVPGEIGGSYFGNVLITSPVTVAVQLLNLDLWNVGGVLSGTINTTETALYPDGVGLNGIADGGYLPARFGCVLECPGQAHCDADLHAGRSHRRWR